jgi:glucokinase
MQAAELVTLTMRELDRLKVIEAVAGPVSGKRCRLRNHQWPAGNAHRASVPL